LAYPVGTAPSIAVSIKWHSTGQCCWAGELGGGAAARAACSPQTRAVVLRAGGNL